MVKKKVTKKRGVKPGTKRGRYKKETFKVGDTVTFGDSFTPAMPLTLCGQLEDAILLLETRIYNAIAKINSLM